MGEWLLLSVLTAPGLSHKRMKRSIMALSCVFCFLTITVSSMRVETLLCLLSSASQVPSLVGDSLKIPNKYVLFWSTLLCSQLLRISKSILGCFQNWAERMLLHSDPAHALLRAPLTGSQNIRGPHPSPLPTLYPSLFKSTHAQSSPHKTQV